MVLFTTPDPTPSRPSATPPVVESIRTGADQTGTDFGYLLRTAKRESALDPTAKAPTSSATGLFQFIEQTWLGLVKSDGDRAGLGQEARSVTARPDGTYTVADPAARQAILKLREDPEVASVMAGAFTRQNRDLLTGAIGRAPSAGELYVAHVLGARGAADLIGRAATEPASPAAAAMPEAARANRTLFYDRSGRARGAGEVYGLLSAVGAGTPGSGLPSGTAPSPVGVTATGTVQAAATVTGYHPPGLEGLFQTGPRPGPVSDAVARLWRSPAQAQAIPGRSFFPRGVGSGTVLREEPASVPDPASTPAPDIAPGVTVPLPPPRPASLSALPSGPAIRAAEMRAGSARQRIRP